MFEDLVEWTPLEFHGDLPVSDSDCSGAANEVVEQVLAARIAEAGKPASPRSEQRVAELLEHLDRCRRARMSDVGDRFMHAGVIDEMLARDNFMNDCQKLFTVE